MFQAKYVVAFLLESQEDFMMESSISDRFISERILHKLKETLQAQSELLGNDLSIQISCKRRPQHFSKLRISPMILAKSPSET